MEKYDRIQISPVTFLLYYFLFGVRDFSAYKKPDLKSGFLSLNDDGDVLLMDW